jgi:tRNA threonylcarbamoyladenosine biosynthesis protein TsaE
VEPFHHVVPALAGQGRMALTLDELVAWGESLGRAIQPPLVIALVGDLGAGKTTLAQAICRGYGVTERVTSPTYTLAHEYESPHGPIHHLDLYRLDDARDLDGIGFDELLGAHALVLVEWPERAASRMPDDRLTLDLAHSADDPSRRILLAG